MSNIYIQEPPTNGKVLLKTTAGDIDIELWSKETPKACRNFIQLCMEGYYDNTIFHRVVPEFIIQGGDPTGTGSGGESIYGAPFKDEFHSRLRFIRRGLVAMANAGPHDNGSQFFFTLGRADELNTRHTVFGKITGDTIYNMLRLSEVEIGKDERPVNPYKITSTELFAQGVQMIDSEMKINYIPIISNSRRSQEIVYMKKKVLFNPFDDIIPRTSKKLKNEKPVEEVEKAKSKGTKNFSLLSFGEEAEEEEVEVNRVSQSMKGKSKSSHDLLKDDPHLSSVPAIDSEKANESDNSDKDEEEGYCDEDDGLDNEEKDQMKKRVMQKLKKNTDVPVKKITEGEQKQKSSRSEELRKEVRQLKRELIKAKQKKEENASKVKEDQFEEEEAAPNSIVAEYLEEKKKYEELRKQQAKKGTSREEQTLALLDRFKSKLNQAISETPEDEVPEPEVENDEGWMSHVLHFEDKTRKVKDASVQDEDTFEIYDPRNPVNKRRREESKKILREKKARR